VRLARIEQAPAPPSAEEQGLGLVADDVKVAADEAGCATGEEQDAIVSVSLTRFALDGADESLVRRGFECMRCTKTASSDALNDRHRAGDRGRNGAISAEALVLDHYGLG
jgi:hypothetical protein